MVVDKNISDVYASFDGLAKLKVQAKKESPETLAKVAKQFEALFLQMLLKNMRAASSGDQLFDSDSSLFYRDMYDKQLALDLSKNSKIGLADLIVKQLGGDPSNSPAQVHGKQLEDYRSQPVRAINSVILKQQLDPEIAPAGNRSRVGRELDSNRSTREFVNEMAPIARRAAEKLGVHPGILVAQAALESGWGQRLVEHDDGRSSHNLFGIKADRRWSGKTASVSTLEFRHGVAVKERADFRAYEDFSESFNDYVQFIKSNPRYQAALANADDPQRYMQELQKAGYATDPLYAKKVMKIFDQHGLNAVSDHQLHFSSENHRLNSLL